VQKSAQELKRKTEYKTGLRVPFECRWEFSTLGIVCTHPGSFRRVPNKGFAGYGLEREYGKVGDKRIKWNKSRSRANGLLAGPFAPAALVNLRKKPSG